MVGRGVKRRNKERQEQRGKCPSKEARMTYHAASRQGKMGPGTRKQGAWRPVSASKEDLQKARL